MTKQISEFKCIPPVYRNPFEKNKAFNKEEIKILNITEGSSPDEIISAQMDLVIKDMEKCENQIEKYVHLMNIHIHNPSLFFTLIISNVELTMPIVYTPTVGGACLNFGRLYGDPKGLYVKYNEREDIVSVLKKWPAKEIKAICVTDGERILGLGDLGTYGMGIPMGKLILYTAIARIKPEYVLPITLDVGTNNQELLNDENYNGSKRKRVSNDQMIFFMDKFMLAVTEVFGERVLIQFEDFGNTNAFKLMERYRNSFCCFNDDIQGTASVTVAGLINACRFADKKMIDCKFLLQGAGEAALGIASLLQLALIEDGLTEEKALSKIWLVDSKGLVVKNRSVGGLNEHKLKFAQEYKEISSLEDIVSDLEPNAIIGVSAIPGSFTKKILETMAKNNKRPIIFALSNPTSKSECTAEEAFNYTLEKCIFASGSPFEPVIIKKKEYKSYQCNNAYIFPAVALATVVAQIRPVDEKIFLFAARNLVKQLNQSEIKQEALFPEMSRIQDVSVTLATNIVEYAYKNKMANHKPEPNSKEKFVRKNLYIPGYNAP